MAKEWRRVWVWTFFRFALFAAEEIIFWMFLVEIFFDLPENRYSWFSFLCFSICCFISSSRNCGMLKILSLFPLAWRMWPIFSGRFMSVIFRFVISETRNPAA